MPGNKSREGLKKVASPLSAFSPPVGQTAFHGHAPGSRAKGLSTNLFKFN
jgi:hypothetical protein